MERKKALTELRPITEDNFLDAFALRLAPGQERFVSHPIRSLAQAYVYREQCQPFGIYADGNMVGYLMVIYDHDVPEYDIWHMMIDAAAQGRGYGAAALDLALRYIGTKPFGDSDRVALTCNRENAIARKLYESRGFRPTGVEDDDEIELALTLG
ncbi:MAG: GNAT family N-acetyltransferase [Clostridiales bacterium]|nr:GNAT family N-acetyltransferase [Clostridiales bacterium]